MPPLPAALKRGVWSQTPRKRPDPMAFVTYGGGPGGGLEVLEVHAARTGPLLDTVVGLLATEPRLAGSGRDLHARREGAAHLLELRAGGHLRGVDRGLDAVEEPLEPAHQLRLSDPQLGVGGGLVVGERQGEPLELVDQLGGQAGLQLLDRAPVDLHEALTAPLVER